MKGQLEKRVAIIVLNWNGLVDTLECLSSLARLTYEHHKVFVVDNSSDEDLTPIGHLFPDAILIRNPENYGYAKGNNIGIETAAELGYEYCWILNNDTAVATKSLNHLVDALEKDKNLAAVTNLIAFYDHRELAWFAGGVFVRGLPAHRGYYQNIKTLGVSDHTDYLSGCSFLARTKALKELNGFDELYFCYVEDVDLSLRMRERGWRIKYLSDATVWHKVSKSTGTLSPIKFYYKRRNMLYFYRQHRFPASTVARYWFSSIRSMASVTLKHRKPRVAWYILRALIDASLGHMGKSRYF